MKTTIQVIKSKEFIIANLKLDDHCKNGHSDFSATGEVYIAGKKRIDRNMVSCGCIHEALLNAFKDEPIVKAFVALHLSDFKGIPMYAVENGFYHLKNNLVHFKSHMRISSEEVKVFEVAEDAKHFQYILESYGMLERWQKEADEAIKMLEEKTGEVVDVSKLGTSRYVPMSEVEKLAMDMLVEDGYYSLEAIEARKIAKLEAEKVEQIKKDRRDVRKVIRDKLLDYKIGKAILDVTFNTNYIFYTHSMELKFNWKDYEVKFSEEEIEKIKNHLTVNYPKLCKYITNIKRG